MDIAIANAAASVVLDDSKQRVVSARIAVGAVAPTPMMATAAADGLAGQEATEESIEAAGEAAKAVASPINDMRGTVTQRVHLVGVLTKRALRDRNFESQGRVSRYGKGTRTDQHKRN